jgi:flagellar hook-basal body complex protein FliE
MNISNISSLSSPAPSALTSKISTGGTETSGGNFGSFVKDAIESIEGTQKNADLEIAKAVTGESPDLHRTIIALQTADLKFQLGLQVRNKLIGAYEEIMRMQV